MPAELELSENSQRFREGFAFLVGAVLRSKRFEDVGDAHAARLHRHLIARKTARIPFAIHALVMAARILRHILQVLWPRQSLEHLNRDLDVMVYDLALRGRERAGAYAQILSLVCRQKIHQVALYVVPAVLGRDCLDPLLIFDSHRLAADIAGTQKFTVFVDFTHSQLEFALELERCLPVGFLERFELGSEQLNLGIALDDLEARIHQMDAVKYGFQLGRLVDYVHWRGDFAAVMQKACDLQLVAILGAHAETLERPDLDVVDRFREHHRQERHALAVPGRVRGFIVDRGVDQIDE